MYKTRALLGKLRRLTNLMQRARIQEFADHDFNMMDGKGRLLGVLHEKDGLTQRELGEVLDIRPSSVGELVRKLEMGGLVVRKNNERDRRVMNVYLTDAGRELVSDTSSVRTEIQACVFKDISEEEKDVFARVLERMIASLEDEYPADAQDERFVRGAGRNRNCRGRVGRGMRVEDGRMHQNQGKRRGQGRCR